MGKICYRSFKRLIGLCDKKYPPEEWLIETGEPPVKAWYTIQDMAYEKGFIKDRYIDKCKYMFFDIRDVVSLYRQSLKENAFKLYGFG